MADATPARPNKNWLLIKFREWHSWGGLFLSAFILLVAVTGILLNHKDLFFHRPDKKTTGALTASTDLAALPITFGRALELGRDHYGDVPLEKVELKDEGGRLMYKVCRGGGEEIRIDAQTGEVLSKYGYGHSGGAKGTNWAKIVDDLHTGKILGGPGKLLIDLTSGTLIVLTLTGIYLWGVPWLRKRRSAREREAKAQRKPQEKPTLAGAS